MVVSSPDLSASAQTAEPTLISDSGGASSSEVDPAIAPYCSPLSDADPCGPDLDFEADASYLNFFAEAELVLPSSFFSAEDGRPFDRTAFDAQGQLDKLKRLTMRSRDLRLLVCQARFQILNRDLAGFATSVRAIAYLLDHYWDTVHPRAGDGDFALRSAVVGALDMSTVTIAVQYVPLFEARRMGAITYRGLMIAKEEVQPRPGESKLEVGPMMEALSQAEPAALARTRGELSILRSALSAIGAAFLANGQSPALKSLPELLDRIIAFVDPGSLDKGDQAIDVEPSDAAEIAAPPAGAAPNSLLEAKAALAAIADYYSRREPSSPALPLVRQAHQLIGKSFFDIINILVPAHMDQAAFRIGHNEVFDLPIGKLSDLSEVAQIGSADDADGPIEGTQLPNSETANYTIETRSQAIALLDLVQRFFRKSEPSSPVPMLCERARALAERDFMSVLKDVLPRSALRNPNEET
ncbi:type VI secretion system ImpA family N-terminal domain-containing protein [Bradyrhizobium jicamae]|uniref:Type VI secretion system ImpA family N-terminal domain-containing protein n=1 Tax=Bradyrhizobium jicamae TaxID=280332 RepID=A0ABS5FVG0_9BRAD|nr:type VI secretion system ImpA family N-terminal domain-containing protein [Bradyrhizobium jicamae]MBR0800723.1 type VI secretion system ImpA family N-terminal domain-containing protein [Bradyrhizobium jicamae]MBR0936609.1 type VI secretion system ImpA family N-terminal domain-containing protein [Bradyrhizobium jicamae]